MDKRTIKNPGKQSFLRAVPAAAAAGVALTDRILFRLGAEAQADLRRPADIYRG